MRNSLLNEAWMISKIDSMARGTIPGYFLIPCIVKVFPEPVCP